MTLTFLESNFNQRRLEKELFKPVNDILEIQGDDVYHWDPNSEEAKLASHRKDVIECMEDYLAKMRSSSTDHDLANSIGSIREILVEIRSDGLEAWPGSDPARRRKVNPAINNFIDFTKIVDGLSKEFVRLGINANRVTPGTEMSNNANNAIHQACKKLNEKFKRRERTVSVVKPHH